MVLKQPTPQVKYVDLDHMIGFADRGETWVSNLRDDLLEPWPRKQSPMVTASRLAKLCKVERARIQYLVTKGNAKGEYPTGSTSGNNRHREFTIADVQAFVRRAGPYSSRPENGRGIAIAVGNFKGGVGKTTLSVALAQGLTLRGHKVLLVDLDPQASSTTLMGYVPTAEIGEAQTVMPFIYGDEPNLDYSIVESYWPNLHLIPASPVLFGADYYLPAKQSRDPNYEYWAVLEQAMPRLREQYDVIVFDTPPSLAYLATNCFMSSDALVIPLPPETLDFVSSTAFFRQFADLFSGLRRNRDVEKRFEFIKIFLSKVRPRVQSTSVVSSWIQEAYPEMLGRAELFESDVVKKASTEFKTVYDLDPRDYEGSMQLLNRTLDAFDDMIDEIQEQLEGIWSIQKTELEVSHGE
ncbi:chromosome partitioning protein [Burkholderia gladioli]|uniref:Chromosome partitioning protein n=1 Tax=Burkholderia gladioli TaxID=28095 RepID=A0A2A7SAB5_BURGA|nr:ParA family protein [Burkholderia gladioli]PEH40496.1 chromosome partitioning protein [Burkholderia gladioli]